MPGYFQYNLIYLYKAEEVLPILQSVLRSREVIVPVPLFFPLILLLSFYQAEDKALHFSVLRIRFRILS